MPIQPTKTFELYDGKIIIDFYEGKHRYVIRGRDQSPISVTAATGMVDKSTALIIWATRLSGDFLKRLIAAGEKITLDAIDQAITQYRLKKTEAATTGTAVHDWIEKHIAGEKQEMPNDEKVLNGIMAFLDWVKKNGVEFIESEAIVYSKKYDYVGKMDVKLKLNWKGKKGVKKFGDFKTNNWSTDKETGEKISRIYDEQRYQLAAYKNAYEEERGETTDGRILICIDKDTGEFAVHDLDKEKENYQKDLDCFLATLTLKRRNKELDSWGK